MIYDLLMWVADSLLTVWFFRSFREKMGQTSVVVRILAVMILGLTLPLYVFNTSIHGSISRYLIRWGAVTGFLACGSVTPWTFCLYYAALFTSSLSILQSVIPLVDYLLRYQTPLVKAVCILVETAGLTAVSQAIPFQKIRTIRTQQILVIALITGFTIYCKTTTGKLTSGGILPSAELFGFSSVVLMLSLIVLASFDRFMVLSAEQRRQELIDLSRDYQYANLRSQLAAQEDLRRVHHDMKNHLLAVQAMSTDAQKEYIASVLRETDSYGELFDTGNETLDGLLRAKLAVAKEKEVQLSVNLDLSALGYLEPVDVCAIFGNVIDNALEASEKLPDPADRFVELKSGEFADKVAIRVINTFPEGSLQLVDGRPAGTSKADKSRHGIGLSSVRRSVEKYGGTISFQTTPAHRLLVTILLPRTRENA